MSGKQSHKEEKLEEKVLFVNRCAKVIKGGRKFSFSALILVGDNKGRVGYGFAKANELTDAIRKGGEAARKNMITCQLHGDTIPHEVLINHDGAKVLLKPAKDGTGVVAGSCVRAMLEFVGIKNVVSKCLGSTNPINQAKAAFKALSSLRSREQINEIRK